MLDNVNFSPFSSLLLFDIESYSLLTDASFSHMTSLQTLRLANCNHITNDVFARFPELTALDISDCDQLSDAAFVNAPFLHRLRSCRIDGCILSDKSLSSMEEIELLLVDTGSEDITDAAFTALTKLTWLDISSIEYSNRQRYLSAAAISHLTSLRSLRMCACHGIDDAAFVHLRSLTHLDVSECTQLTDAAFSHFSSLIVLNMAHCYQNGITDNAFTHLSSLERLYMQYCNQFTITTKAFDHLSSLTALDIHGCTQLNEKRVFEKLPKLRITHYWHLKLISCKGYDCRCSEYDRLASEEKDEREEVSHTYIYTHTSIRIHSLTRAIDRMCRCRWRGIYVLKKKTNGGNSASMKWRPIAES